MLTHAHSDHARPGSRSYLAAAPGLRLLQARLGAVAIDTLPYGEAIVHNGVRISLHPAGHVLGSAQVRLECLGQVAVVSGDYKLASDPTCTPFEPVRCHTFVTESTFGLPIYRWPDASAIFDQINAWWRGNRDAGKASLLYAYSLGKAQRLLAGLDSSIGPIFTHGAVEKVTQAYRDSGVSLPATTAVAAFAGKDFACALVLAPPSAHGTPWTRRFGQASSAFASGWMTIRGTRRRRAVDRGLVLSDHADWPGLQIAIAATGASTVLVTHGYVATLVRWLRDQGTDAQPLQTEYAGEIDDAVAEETSGGV